jgi:thymidine phosphorylase
MAPRPFQPDRFGSLVLGIHVKVVYSALQSITGGIGPALEARDVPPPLTGASAAPSGLRSRAFVVAGMVLELRKSAGEDARMCPAAAALMTARLCSKFEQTWEGQSRDVDDASIQA